MYLYIFEDSSVYFHTGEISQEDYDQCDDGYIDIIDISDPKNPKQYYKSKWHEIPKS